VDEQIEAGNLKMKEVNQRMIERRDDEAINRQLYSGHLGFISAFPLM
jgi:hypothetical protein